MNFIRTLMSELRAWKERPTRCPLILRGARQVGKTHLIKQFGETHFDSMVTINLEQQMECIPCFDSLQPQRILSLIEAIIGHRIIPGQTLFFIDEIQQAPNAIHALRYFKEQMPALHVMAAGSLLDFTLHERMDHMPVGRIEFLHLKPFSFNEYLNAVGATSLQDELSESSLNTPLPSILHSKALEHVRYHMVIGGMPASITAQVAMQGLHDVQRIQFNLLQTYQHDFKKYSKHSALERVELIFNQIPQLIGKPIKYSQISQHHRAHQLKAALNLLTYAGILQPILSTSGSSIPLNALADDKHFKCIFLDTGLVMAQTQLQPQWLLDADIMLTHRGAMAEQWVGQELLAYQRPYQPGQLFFWKRDKPGSQAEIDYLIQHEPYVIPVEVKAGKTGTLRSWKVYREQHQPPIGVRLCTQPLSLHDGLLTVPFYLLQHLPRLIDEAISRQ